MTAPNGAIPDGSLGRGLFRQRQLQTEAEAKAQLTNGAVGAGGTWTGAQNKFKLEIRKPIEDQGLLIAGYGQQIEDLEDVTRTGVTTPAWASAGGRDLVTFPDTMMQKLWYYDGSSYTWTDLPAFRAEKRSAEFAFLRGGLDRPTPLQVLRIITGADSGFFGIDAWYLGIYGYDEPNNRMIKVWDSGDLKAVLVNQRRRYHIATGLSLMAEPDQLFAVASLQIAPGALQSTRGHGAINLTGISEEAGTVPQARHARLVNQSVLPSTVSMSSFTYDKDVLMWASLGASAT